MRSVVSLPSRISPAREFGVTNKVDNGGALLRGRKCAFLCLSKSADSVGDLSCIAGHRDFSSIKNLKYEI